MITQDAVMTTQDVANRFYQLAQESKWAEIVDEMYADDVQSIEPPGAEAAGLKNVQGIDAVRKKGEAFSNMVEEMYGGFCSAPVVGGDYFAVAMGMDVKMKGAERMNMDEIAVYEVKDGKITKEQFFF